MGKVPKDILFLDGPKLLIEGFTWAPEEFMKRHMSQELKGTYEGAMSVVSQEESLGEYFCLLFKENWSFDEPPRDYRIQISENQHLGGPFRPDYIPR